MYIENVKQERKQNKLSKSLLHFLKTGIIPVWLFSAETKFDSLTVSSPIRC